MFPPDVPSIDAKQVDVSGTLLDVREPEEWNAGHIEGARHIPLADVPVHLADLIPTAPIVVVCRSGQRSARVVTFLQRQGLDAVNLTGGMIAWTEAGRPMVSETGADPVVR